MRSRPSLSLGLASLPPPATPHPRQPGQRPLLVRRPDAERLAAQVDASLRHVCTAGLRTARRQCRQSGVSGRHSESHAMDHLQHAAHDDQAADHDEQQERLERARQLHEQREQSNPDRERDDVRSARYRLRERRRPARKPAAAAGNQEITETIR